MTEMMKSDLEIVRNHILCDQKKSLDLDLAPVLVLVPVEISKVTNLVSTIIQVRKIANVKMEISMIKVTKIRVKRLIKVVTNQMVP